MELTSTSGVLRGKFRFVMRDIKLHGSYFHENYKPSADFEESDLDDEIGSFHCALKVVVSIPWALSVISKLSQTRAFYETGGSRECSDKNHVDEERQDPDDVGRFNHLNSICAVFSKQLSN